MTDVELQPLTLHELDLLASCDLAAATRSVGLPITPVFLDDQWVWQHFAELIRGEPETAWWRTQYLVVARDERARIVGHARLHSGPDENGEVHVGYATDPIERGRGYARQALHRLVDLASTRSEARTLVALIDPDNAASLAVARGAGFVDDGEQRHRLGWLMRRLVLPMGGD